jgi:hypothetical protein
MTKLDSNTAPKSGAGADTDRLSDSRLSIRRGNADPVDIGAGEATKDAGQLNYDANNLPLGVAPPAFGASH